MFFNIIFGVGLVTLVVLNVLLFLRLRKEGETTSLFLQQQKDFYNKLNDIEDKITKAIEKVLLKEEQMEFMDFIPYFAMATEDCEVYLEDLCTPFGLKKENSFFTIVFEKSGYGRLLEGGWVDLQFIIKNPKKNPSLKSGKIILETKVFNGPGQGYQEIGVVKKDTPVEIVETFNYWKKIRGTNGRTGYVWFENVLEIQGGKEQQ